MGENPDIQEPLSLWEAIAHEHFLLTNRKPGSAYLSLEKEYQDARTKYRCVADKDASKSNELVLFRKAERRLGDFVCSELLHPEKRSALCLSGGGIRSATFSLGILQGLAKHSCYPKGNEDPKLLAEFDYLSTVSGGGYLGAWFSSWIYRANGDLKSVVQELARVTGDKLNPEPAPVRHLRSYSNYLNPKLGLTSADTWTLAATIVRNILLNWLVLLPLLAAVLTIPRITLSIVNYGHTFKDATHLLAALLGLAALGGILAFTYVVVDLPSGGDTRFDQARFLWLCLLPLGISAIASTLYRAWTLQSTSPGAVNKWLYLSAPIFILVCGSVLAVIRVKLDGTRISWRWAFWGFICIVIAGLFGGWLLWLIDSHLPILVTMFSKRLYTLLAFPAMFLVLFVSLALLVGFTSRITEDEDREWFARAGAWALILVLSWLVFGGLVMFGPTGFLLAKAALATGAGAALSRLGFSSLTKAGRDTPSTTGATSSQSNRREIAWRVLLPIFIVLAAVAIASVNEELVRHLPLWFTQLPQVDYSVLKTTPSQRLSNAPPGAVTTELVLTVASFLLALIASLSVNVNKFSLHGMYRARLIRAYLGASQAAGCRRPNLFTGFDPSDNIRLASLKERPLHIVNMALNLVGGENLAWQQRKAASFTANRFHTGNCWLGYRPTCSYSEKGRGFTLGGAMAISGAAASPNMGYHSSPLLTVVMTLFNARLGAWLGNPGRAGGTTWYRNGPTSGLWTFIDELLGRTNEDNDWVYLSDGGHFENLGLYEMVLRRCHTIVVIDASADSDFQFGDLGNALRKIRVDLGISVEFPNGIPIKNRDDLGKHCAVGYVRYSQLDGVQEDGKILYIKPSLNQNEPVDVRQYAEQNRGFPHQSTADQWFDESQFESYRQLGFHTVSELLGFQYGVFSLTEFLETVERKYLGLPSHEAHR